MYLSLIFSKNLLNKYIHIMLVIYQAETSLVDYNRDPSKKAPSNLESQGLLVANCIALEKCINL